MKQKGWPRMSGAVFSAEALDANRNGQLSAGQRRELQAGLGRKHSGLTGLVGRALDPLAKDLQAGCVESIEGAIRKRPPQSMYGGTAPIAYRYRVLVANREVGSQEFRCSREIYEFAPDAGMVRLFYLPRSPWVVNLELLSAAPAGNATARPSTKLPVDPRALAEAIIGTWESPFLNVSLGRDGTFAARLLDGSHHQGRWSVDASGRLHADMMGSPMVADAWVDAGELTLVLDDQALKLRRAASS
jgi:hypothetical protein